MRTNLFKKPRLGLSQSSGFTIIEVLIVLAIAALILVIVFLAVPTLQRNSRNTQIRNDAANLLGYVNDYAANNNGALPGVGCYDTTTGNVGFVASGACSTTTNLVGKVRGGLTIVFTTTAPTQPAGTNSVTLALGWKCNGTSLTGATVAGRAAAVGFKVETGGAPLDQCQDG